MLTNFKNWLSAQLFSETTIYNYYYSMKSFFEQNQEFNKETILKHINYIRTNFSIGNINAFIKAGKQYSKFSKIEVEFPTIKKVESKIPEYISEENFLDILDKLPVVTNSYIKWKAVLCLIFYCGLRRKEICSLSRKDFNWENNTVKIYKTKTKTPRILPFPKKVGEFIQQYFNIENENISAFNINNQHINYIFNKIKTELNLEQFYPHLLRHSCARYLLKKGIPINEVQVITGHKNLQSLQIYLKCHNEEVNNLYSKKIQTEIDKRGKKK